MVVANFRFYEELNDFLPSPRRKCDFACACAGGATVKHAIEALGVPHTKVELILANGESVDFSYVVQEGDRISLSGIRVTRRHPVAERREQGIALQPMTQMLQEPPWRDDVARELGTSAAGAVDPARRQRRPLPGSGEPASAAYRIPAGERSSGVGERGAESCEGALRSAPHTLLSPVSSAVAVSGMLAE